MPRRSHGNITRRVLASVTALSIRTAWERGTTLVSTLILARLLVPQDFGVAAIVLSITAVLSTLTDGGITTALVRRPASPTKQDFDFGRKMQLLLSGVVLLCVACAALVEPAYVPLVLLDCVQLPSKAATLRVRVSLQRTLDFRGLAFSDGLGQLAQASTALALVLVDRGPGALVGADLAGSLTAAAYIGWRLRSQITHPDVAGEGGSLRSTLREGLPFQGFALSVTLRELATSIFISVVVGVRDLGLLQFAYRLLSPVMIVFQAVGQLSVPLGTEIMRRDDRARESVRGGFLLAGMITAVLLAVVAAPAHWLVPAVFGSRWDDSVPVIVAIAFALVLVGPLNSLGVGLLVAAGRTGVAILSLLGCSAWFMASMAALSTIGGIRSAAIAWVSMAVVEALSVLYFCSRLLRLPLWRPTFVPPVVFALAYAAGVAAAHLGSSWVIRSVAGAGAAALVGIALATVFALRPLQSLLRDARDLTDREDSTASPA